VNATHTVAVPIAFTEFFYAEVVALIYGHYVRSVICTDFRDRRLGGVQHLNSVAGVDRWHPLANSTVVGVGHEAVDAEAILLGVPLSQGLAFVGVHSFSPHWGQ